MKRRRRESGFALLLVFLMAAVIAISLYMEIPRVAFESQRQKEQLLVERGEQYKLAIRRFLQANPNRWPASMDELESFNNRRFLRHRYIDPMTGKDEWRLIHIQNGVLTDSKNNKPKTDDQAKESKPNTFIQEQAGLGSVGVPGANAQSAWKNRRPSDEAAGAPPGGAAGAPQDPNNPNPVPGQAGVPPPVLGASGTGVPGATVPGQPPQPGYPAMPGIGVMPPGVPSAPGAQPGGTGGFIVNQPGLGSIGTGSTTTGATGQPVYPGQQQYPGGMPGMPPGSQPGGMQPYPTMPGAAGAAPGYGQPGTTPGNQNQAIGLINNILTSPRPGGLAGIQGGPGLGQPGGLTTGQFGGMQPGATPLTGGGLGGPATMGMGGMAGAPGSPVGSPIGGAGGMTIGGGLAGVASTLDADSIMVYADHTNYSEWEFVFDPTKWHAPPNPNQGTIGTSANQMGTSANNLNSGVAGSGASATTGFNSGPGGGPAGSPGGFGSFGSSPAGQQPGGQQPGGQMGTTGMAGSAGSSAFGGGGAPDIRPGRK